MRNLVWTRDGERHFHSHFGGLHVGSVGARDDGSAYWSIDAVYMKWVAKGRDLHAPSLNSAVRALERSWAIWLKRSGLGLADGRETVPDEIWGERLAGRPKEK